MSKNSKPLIIAVLNQKGGSGKTTISTNLAHSFILDNKKVLLVDSDPQGSARDWNDLNEGNIMPVVGLDRETLAKDLEAIWSGYDIVVIDGAPQIAKMSAAAVKIADFVLIPVQPSPYDIWACADLVDIIHARQEVTDGKPKAVFVISRVIKNTKLSQEIEGALEDYKIPVLKSFTTQRVFYPTTASLGETVFFYKDPLCNLTIIGRIDAAKEINAIKDEIMEMINGSQN